MESYNAEYNNIAEQKEMIAKYVHDIADMEVRHFTLQEIICNSPQSTEQKKNEIETKVYKWKIEFEKAQQECTKNEVILSEVKDRKKYAVKYHSEEYSDDSLLTGYRICLGIMIFLILVSICILSNGIIDAKNFDSAFTAVLPITAVVIIAFVILKCSLNSRIKERQFRAIVKQEALVKENKKRVSENQELYERAVAEQKEFIENILPNVQVSVQEMKDSCEQIRQDLDRCYALGIVKPSYRNLISLVILDDIFINDKADTMREAMILCDVEIRHAELIGKLDEVVTALRALADSIQSIHAILNTINMNVSMISQDIYKMTESQERIAYAAESVKKSADNVDTYIYQKRVGMI